MMPPCKSDKPTFEHVNIYLTSHSVADFWSSFQAALPPAELRLADLWRGEWQTSLHAVNYRGFCMMILINDKHMPDL